MLTTKKVRGAKKVCDVYERRAGSDSANKGVSARNGQPRHVDEIFYVNEVRGGSSGRTSFRSDMATFMPYLDPGDRLTMMIAGANGCGKSYFIARTVLPLYMAAHPDRPIFMFTGIDVADANFAHLAGSLSRVKLDLETLGSLKLEDLRCEGTGSLCIFDDVDRLRDKAVQRAVYDLAGEILSNGRDHATQTGASDVDIIITNHEINDYQRTKNILTECAWVVLFPTATTHGQLDRILGKIGCSKRQAEAIKNYRSGRSVLIHKTMPLFFVTQHEVALLR